MSQQGTQWAWLAVVFLIVAAHVGPRYLTSFFNPTVHMYVVQPAFWCVPAVVAVIAIERRWPSIRASPDVIALAGLIGVCQVMLSFVAGVLIGFGHSPYDHSARGLTLGLWYALSILVYREIARWSILQAFDGKREWVAIAVASSAFWLTAFPLSGFNRLSSPDTAFQYAGTVILPAAAASIFASYVARTAGPVASLAYLFPLVLFEWSSPILPNLPWAVSALIGVLVPLLGLSLIEATGELDKDTASSQVDESKIGMTWVVAAVMILLVVWFNTGVFGVKPTLVHGHSMEPNFHTGDVALTKPVDPADLKVGDVIRWDEGSYEVLHRIIEIRHDGNELIFVTKGDNNDGPDPAIRSNQIKGLLVAQIPRVGMPGVYFKRMMTALTS